MWRLLLVIGSSVMIAGGQDVLIPGLGWVRGSTSTTFRTNDTVFNFRSIPYAQSPSGTRRFQAPENVRPWLEILDATQQRRSCPQESSDPSDPGDPEDCLHLNVFSKSLSETAMQPVMMFIHGGSYVAGSSEPFVPDFLLDRDIVLVAIQYRLGALGFLSLHSDTVPGNAALLDVVEALRWVRDHIQVFGGDPNRVTVFGQSAGSLLTSFLLVMPPAQGLFHRLVLQSGSFLAHPYLELDPVPHAHQIAQLAGCKDLNTIEDCLLLAPASNLVSALATYFASNIASGGDGKRGACPVVQKAGAVIAVPELPAAILQTGRASKVPIIVGTAIHEGVYYYGRVHEPYIVANNLARDELFLREEMVEYILKLGGLVDTGHVVVGPVQDTYLTAADTAVIENMFTGIVDLFTQYWMKAPSHRLTEMQSRYNVSSFYYSFHFPGEASTTGIADHGAELGYLFPQRELTTLEQDISWRMVQLWTNFATYGNPTPAENIVNGVPEWPSYEPGVKDNPYMIMNANFSIGLNLKTEFDIAVRQNLNLTENFPVP